ncbi:IS3 family transposase [Corynebacterium kutscheri]
MFWYNNGQLQQRFKGLIPMQYQNQTLETLTT